MFRQNYYFLNNGIKIPVIGFGVFQINSVDALLSVKDALKIGYRMFDTAPLYKNEIGVGRGIKESGVLQKDVFIESKVWVTDYGFENTISSFEKSIKRIGVRQLDLLVLHHPLPSRFELTVDAYKALEHLLTDEKVRAIGVSNFRIRDLEKLMEETTVIPSVNQVEFHPYFQPNLLDNFHRKHGILTQCWSPIGGITFYPGWRRKGITGTLSDPVISTIAKKYNKTPAQVILRWHLDNGRQIIPKSKNSTRRQENFNVFDFRLNIEERLMIENLNTGIRFGPDPETVGL